MSRPDVELLLALILPQPHPLATPWARLDWPGFWAIFDVRAPLHLRWGLPLAALVVGSGYLRLRVGAGWRELGRAEVAVAGVDRVAADILRADVVHADVVHADVVQPDIVHADSARLQAALRDAARSPWLGPLVEVLKVVAALAYFDDAQTDRALRASA